MNVFLSWSGEMSHRLAIELHKWLPLVLQNVVPFESSEDIRQGTRWSGELSDQLKKASFGVVCLTPYNVQAPWVLFEAGALSSAIGGGCVAPLLFRLTVNDVVGPLQQFQVAVCDEAGVRSLVTSINDSLPLASRLDPERLDREFRMWWPELEPKLREIPDAEDSGDVPSVFVERRLIRLQQDASCKGVWVVTPDPEGDGIERTIWPGIVTNIRRGVSYTFVLPASKSQDGAVGRLAEVFSEANHGAKIVGIRDDQFTQLAVTDYVVINPWDSNPRAFLQVPAEPRGLWVEVSGAAALGLVKRFENMISPPADAASETPRASHVGQS